MTTICVGLCTVDAIVWAAMGHPWIAVGWVIAAYTAIRVNRWAMQ